MWLRINGSASAKGANTPVCEPRWPILITFEVAALAVVPRKITGPVIAVAPRSLITSRRRHNLLAEFPVLILLVSVTPPPPQSPPGASGSEYSWIAGGPPASAVPGIRTACARDRLAAPSCLGH